MQYCKCTFICYVVSKILQRTYNDEYLQIHILSINTLFDKTVIEAELGSN